MLATSQTCNICDNCLQREKLQYIFPTAAATLQEDAAEVMPTELSPRHLRHSAFVDDFVQLCAHRHSISSIFYSTARCCMLYGLTLLLFLFYSHARHSIIAMKSWHLMGFHHVAVRLISYRFKMATAAAQYYFRFRICWYRCLQVKVY